MVGICISSQSQGQLREKMETFLNISAPNL